MLTLEAWELKIKIAWLTASAVIAAWFLYWISYDMIAWQKAPLQVPLINYMGLSLSIFFFVSGFKVSKVLLQKKALTRLPKQEKPKEPKKQAFLVNQAPQPIMKKSLSNDAVSKGPSTQKIMKGPEEKVENANRQSPKGCEHHLGYLHERPKSTAIPQNCITCADVVKCLSRNS